MSSDNDCEAARRYFEEMCIPYPDEREIDRFLAGRASMRAEVDRIRNYEEMKTRAEKAEKQLAQARALLQEAADRGALACVASTPCEDCWRCRIHAHLESEGSDE